MEGLLKSVGFVADPFEYTDADREQRLDAYFVPPPYFDAVLGDPKQPASTFVFAPRGSGKSAQRRTIEQMAVDAAEAQRFLCVTYDEFDQPAGFKPINATWEYHIEQVIRGIALQVLVALDSGMATSVSLTKTDKEILSGCIKQYLGSLTAEQYGLALRSIRSLRERADRFWARYGGPVGLLVSSILNKLGLPTEDMPAKMFASSGGDVENRRVVLHELLRIVRQLGYASTYVLIDRVDELSQTTNNSQNSFDLVRHLALDLATLETDGIAFKFFLWDELKSLYRAGGARVDRVREFSLQWRFTELETMLSRRLMAHSDMGVSSFNQLIKSSVAYDAHAVVARLAAGSPRDMIRLCGRIISENGRQGHEGLVSQNALLRGVWEFCRERAQELCDFSEIARVQAFHFTVNQLASDVFRVSTQNMKSRVERWCDSGVAAKIGTEATERRGRPRDLYGITDVRVGLAARPFEDVALLLEAGILVCPSCQDVFLAEERRILCTRCGAEPLLSDCVSVTEAETVSGR